MVCLFFNIARQVAICLLTRGRRSSIKWTTSTRVKLPRGLPFRTEMSSTVYPRGCGWERGGSTCAVRAPLLFVHIPTYVGVCERYTNLDIMRRPSPCLRPVQPPVTTMPHSSSPYLSSFSRYHFLMKFSRYHFSDKILEISLVFTHGITPTWVCVREIQT